MQKDIFKYRNLISKYADFILLILIALSCVYYVLYPDSLLLSISTIITEVCLWTLSLILILGYLGIYWVVNHNYEESDTDFKYTKKNLIMKINGWLDSQIKKRKAKKLSYKIFDITTSLGAMYCIGYIGQDYTLLFILILFDIVTRPYIFKSQLPLSES